MTKSTIANRKTKSMKKNKTRRISRVARKKTINKRRLIKGGNQKVRLLKKGQPKSSPVKSRKTLKKRLSNFFSTIRSSKSANKVSTKHYHVGTLV